MEYRRRRCWRRVALDLCDCEGNGRVRAGSRYQRRRCRTHFEAPYALCEPLDFRPQLCFAFLQSRSSTEVRHGRETAKNEMVFKKAKPCHDETLWLHVMAIIESDSRCTNKSRGLTSARLRLARSWAASALSRSFTMDSASEGCPRAAACGAGDDKCVGSSKWSFEERMGRKGSVK